MDPQTLNLLRLLSSEENDEVLEKLRGGALSEKDLAGHLRVSQPTANRRLNSLGAPGLLVSEIAQKATGKRGQRPRIWSVANESVIEFCDKADEFTLALAEARIKSLRRRVERQRRN